MKIHAINLDQFLHQKDIHGTHDPKTLMVLHETVSPDLSGLADIDGVAQYLDRIDYFIHGMTDLEGHQAWAYGHGNAIFYQCGGVNTQSCGIEQISYIPQLLHDGKLTMAQAAAQWKARDKQLHATARLIACWHHVDPTNRPIQYCEGDGGHHGVTSHYDVSQHFAASEGHSDCRPIHKGGYYPILEVVDFAKTYAKLGYQF